MIVFTAEMEVTHQDSDLGTSQDEDNKDHKQKANTIVYTMEPDRVKDKVNLDKDSTKG